MNFCHKMNKMDKNKVIFTPEMLDIINGMLLGNAYLSKRESNNAHIRFDQANKEFIDHLYNQLKTLVKTGPKELKRLHKKYNKTYTSYYFNTLNFPYFTEIYSNWYIRINNKNVKILPTNIAELLTPRAIAYWIMCDGYYHKTNKTIIISTDSFSLNEVDTLRDILLSKYNIKSTRYLNGHKC
jgi:hypothetical protein